MTIRIYTPGDRNSCIEIFNSNTPAFFAPEELDDFKKWLNGRDENRLAYKTTGEEHFYVAEENNKILGCGGFYIPREEQRGNIVWGMIHASEHGRGYGKELLNYRIAVIKKLYPDYSISLDTTQHTFRFFEKKGFTVTKITKDCYGPGLDRYDMISAKK